LPRPAEASAAWPLSVTSLLLRQGHARAKPLDRRVTVIVRPRLVSQVTYPFRRNAKKYR
jgi:hypothetical protein